MVARPRKWYEVAEKVVDSVEEERKAEMTPAQSALLDKYRHLLRRGFRGAYVHGLDTKGRMIVPASFRQALGDRFYICMTPDFKAIAIYPQHEWELYYCSLLELAEKDMRMERVINLFSKYTYDDCECDAQGRVLLYADKITPAMRAAMDETARRRQIQDAYNKAHGIVPKTIVKSIRDLIEISASPTPEHKGKGGVKMTRQELAREIEKLEAQMRKAAHMMEYEYAAVLRDEIIRLRTEADKKS